MWVAEHYFGFGTTSLITLVRTLLWKARFPCRSQSSHTLWLRTFQLDE